MWRWRQQRKHSELDGRLAEKKVNCRFFAAQQIGDERNQRACHRQLVRNVIVARRVNSTVGRASWIDH